MICTFSKMMVASNRGEKMDNLDNTKFAIETTDEREMLLYLNASRMVLALDELLNWYKEIYNGKDYGYKILYKNKEYDLSYWDRNYKTIVDTKDLDKDGYPKPSVKKEIYTSKYIEDKLNECLSDVSDFVNQYMGY